MEDRKRDHRQANEVGLENLADADGVLRVRVQPGPNMHWFAQGFFMGWGYLTALVTASLLFGVVFALLIAIAVAVNNGGR
jgi:hypothetical protein